MKLGAEFFHQAFGVAHRQLLGGDLVGGGDLGRFVEREQGARMAHVEVARHQARIHPVAKRVDPGGTGRLGIVALHAAREFTQVVREAARTQDEHATLAQGREEVGAEIEPNDRLKFRDSKKYKDRLTAAQKETGEKDALVAMRGELDGLPVVAVPVPLKPMPIGVQIIAAPWREDVALRVAYALEQAGAAVAPRPKF